MKLLSVNVGGPREVEWQGKTVRTAIWKEPVTGPRMVRRINIDGDDQADRLAHGGEHRAVVRTHGDRVGIDLLDPAHGIAPGQSAVMYDGTRVVGSATITATR